MLKGGVGLSPEERKRSIDTPGTPWKEWFFATALKPWVILGLLLSEGLGLLSVYVAVNGALQAVTIILFVLSIYADVLLWNLLWRVPSPDEWKSGKFTNYRWQPFKVGRWTPEYPVWKSGKGADIGASEINPQEFL